jgi:hypothetical protein
LGGAPEIESKVQVSVFRALDLASHDGRATARCPTLKKFKPTTVQGRQSLSKYRYYIQDNKLQ